MDLKMIGLVGVLASAGCMHMDFDLDQGVKGSGKLAKEHRTVSKFSKIELNGAYDVEVKVGPATSVDLSGDDNLLKLVKTTVEDGTLVLTTTKDINTKKPMKVTVTTPDLSAFTLNGAGDVNIEGVKGEEFSIDLSGAGDLSAKGHVTKLSVTMNGAGDVKLYELHADNVTAELNGAGDMKVWASKYLKASMSGAGDLSYKGHPAKVDKDSSGVGDISAAD